MRDNMMWIKTGIIGCIVIFIVCMLMVGGNTISNTTVETMEMRILGASDMGSLTKSDQQMIKKVFGLNAGDYEGVAYYQGSGVMDVDEMLIIKLKDVSQSDVVVDAIRDRVDSQIQSFTGYGADQVFSLNQAIIEVKGNFVFYAVSANAQNYEQIFSDNL